MTEDAAGYGYGDQEEALQVRPVRRRKAHYVVRRMTETGNDPVVFSDADKGVSRRYVETNHPRGMEVYVEGPDGYREHFSADHKYQGTSDGWLPLEEDED